MYGFQVGSAHPTVRTARFPVVIVKLMCVGCSGSNNKTKHSIIKPLVCYHLQRFLKA